jgi:hypothetical protein
MKNLMSLFNGSVELKVEKLMLVFISLSLLFLMLMLKEMHNFQIEQDNYKIYDIGSIEDTWIIYVVNEFRLGANQPMT